jgi:hypothetical protein
MGEQAELYPLEVPVEHVGWLLHRSLLVITTFIITVVMTPISSEPVRPGI